jgi:hypothetical protein
VKLVTDQELLFSGETCITHQGLYIMAIPLIRRDASRRGMGLHQIALFLKLDHLVANSSRAHAQSLASYDIGTHRDALGYVFANYDAEDSIPSSS